MNDLISRQAAMVAVKDALLAWSSMPEWRDNKVLEAIIGLPSAQPGWIPCSERLPKAKQKVLVQYADESMATKRCNDEGHLQWFYANAVAWMPAPEPYKGVTE